MMRNGLVHVTDYHVIGDGSTNNTAAIRQAVEEIRRMGGGTLYFPPGQYLTGTIELVSNMTLYLEGGAVILGSEYEEDYQRIDPETSQELAGQTGDFSGLCGLIYAYKAEFITVAGAGIIDGRGYHWWNDRRNQPRPRAVQPISCDHVRIEGITVLNSAAWTIHPMCCNNVTVDGITIKNPADSPNTDGINPESCSNVHISNCHVDVGDDCITLKAGTEEDEFQRHRPCENITVTNCTMINGHGGVVIGSEMSGGVRNVVISNCIFNGTDRGIRIKTRRKRGGIVEDIRINNIIMTDVFCPVTMNGYYQCGAAEGDMELFDPGPRPVTEQTPVIRNISVSNITSRKTRAAAGYLLGIPEAPIENITFDNITVEMVPAAEKITEKPVMAYHVKIAEGEGFFCTNIKNVRFTNTSVTTVQGPAFQMENCQKVQVNINVEEITEHE